MYSNIAVSIGGSDSGGGAGVQADLRTFMSLKVHGCTVITCVTAQNSKEVTNVEGISNDLIISQINALFSDFNINALKTGMLFEEKIVNCTANELSKLSQPKIIDPVIFSRTGSKLLENNAIDAYKKKLFPQAEIITPNILEANLLSNMDIKNEKDIEKAAKNILKFGSNAVLIKGGGLKEFKGKDFYIDINGVKEWFENKYINTPNTHGSGCTLSAAICSYRALGNNLIEAIKLAKSFTQQSLEESYKIGSGPGPLGHRQ